MALIAHGYGEDEGDSEENDEDHSNVSGDHSSSKKEAISEFSSKTDSKIKVVEDVPIPKEHHNSRYLQWLNFTWHN